tara:strand:- start:68 stop:235 length:168 start_codon:yes stop_codon:yes gene_type:complete
MPFNTETAKAAGKRNKTFRAWRIRNHCFKSKVFRRQKFTSRIIGKWFFLVGYRNP